MNLKIPTPLVDLIYTSIEIDGKFSEFPATVKQKIFSKCIELWIYILDKQNGNFYTNISWEEISKFRFKHNQNSYHYTTLIEILERANILECNDKYSSGKFSKGYRILYNFTTNLDTTEVEIDIDKIFYNIKDKSFWISKYPKHSHLIQDCYKVKIQLNEWVKFLYNNEGMILKPVIENGFLKERTLDSKRILDYILRAIKINVNNIWFGTSEQGRFYSSIASLPSICTPFILLDNRKVLSLDISNCQPLLLSSIINCPKYKIDVENGSLYENVGREFYGEWNDDIKQKIKLQVMVNFFNESPLLSGKFVDSFNKLYPGFINELNKIKEGNKVAHITHSMEASIIVDGVGSLNMTKILKHDEVLIFEENFTKVKTYIENKVKEEYRINKIKIK